LVVANEDMNVKPDQVSSANWMKLRVDEGKAENLDQTYEDHKDWDELL
jgi:hypothetical protein